MRTQHRGNRYSPVLTEEATELAKLMVEGIFARAAYCNWATPIRDAERDLTPEEAEHRHKALCDIHAIDVQAANKAREMVALAGEWLALGGAGLQIEEAQTNKAGSARRAIMERTPA